MNCKNARSILPLYFDNKLGTRELKELEAHLKTCPECSAALHKIEHLAGTLNGMSDVELPESISERLKSQTRPAAPKAALRRVSQRLAASKPRIFRLVANAAYILLLLAAVSVIFKLGFLDRFSGYGWQNSSKTTVTPETSKPEFSPPVTLKNPPKAKADEPGAGELNGSADFNPGDKRFPHPQVLVTNKNYDRDSAADAMIKPSVVEFTLNYTTKHVPYFRENLSREIGSQARLDREDGRVVENCVLSLLAKLDKPALPAYAEKARFEGKDVWLVVVTWSERDSGPDSPLSRASLFIIDPVNNAVAYTQ